MTTTKKISKHEADCLQKLKAKFKTTEHFVALDCRKLFENQQSILDILTQNGYLMIKKAGQYEEVYYLKQESGEGIWEN